MDVQIYRVEHHLALQGPYQVALALERIQYDNWFHSESHMDPYYKTVSGVPHEDRHGLVTDPFYRVLVAPTDDKRPSPGNDGITWAMARSGTYRFGFANKDQLLDWFPRAFLERVERFNWGVSIYTVPEEAVKHGGRQSAFVYDEVKTRVLTSVRNLS